MGGAPRGWPRALAAAVAGGAWVVATFLPWADQGLLSSSTLIDAARFARRGVLDVVPPALAIVLLAPAAVGVVLIGCGGLQGRRAAQVRALAGWVGAVTVVAVVVRLTGGDPSRLGAGGAVALVGAVIFVVGEGAGISAVLFRRARRRH